MRARLIIPLTLGILALAFAAQALAVGAPTQDSPAEGTSFTAGDQIVFRASMPTVGATSKMDFYIARDPTPDASGVFANYIDHFHSGSPVSDGTTSSYSASPGSDTTWPDKPGLYYWQAVSYDCNPTPTDCFNESGTRSLTINPKPASAINSPDDLNTFLDKHPKHRTHKRKVSFSFSSNVTKARFQCLFANGWAKCKSPHVFDHLRPGRYKFKVRAKANGVKDKTPASWVFRILR
jgi:hypothetical protein